MAQVIGSLSVSIEKKTTLPALSSLSYAPSSVTTGDATATFSCDRDGEARVELGGSAYGVGTFVSSGSVNA